MIAKDIPRYVLVADDDASMRALLSEVLVDAGHYVLCAVDGRDALRRLEGRAPDMVVLDLLMPTVTGWDVLSFMERRPRLAHVPVLVLTAFGSADPLPHGRHVLHKPLDPDVFRSMVRKLLPDVSPAAHS